MVDSASSFYRGITLKRSRSATFSPTADTFDDFVPSFPSFGAVFANDISGDIASSALSQFDDDGVYSSNSNGVCAPIGLVRHCIDDLNADLNPEMHRTRTQESIFNQIHEDGLADYVPSLTPRERVDPSGITPRSRHDLSAVDDVKLELVGTTLVGKAANDQVKLDVRSAQLIAFTFSSLSHALQMEAMSSNLEKHQKNFPNINLKYPGSFFRYL
jgi:hypothetical protein